jgi:pimeloyl-ACP methyl ester carboxylesterase
MMKVKSTLLILGLSLLGLTGRAMAAATPAPPHLELAPCKAPLPADARCGTYEVYENRAAKSGRKIALRVIVLPALGADRLPDPFVYFAGGPGDSSVQEGFFVGQELKALRQRRDFLLVDLRGTGESAPLLCPELQGAEGVQGFLDDFMPAAKVKVCRDRLEKTADLSQYTTDNAIDDVDEVRAALGYERVNIMGGSYGTRAVLVYLRRHPDRVRTAVLHGVVPTNDRAPLLFARNTQKALDGLIVECAGDPACAKAFPQLKEEIAAVLATAEKAPVRIGLTDAQTGKPLEVRLSRNAVAQTLRYMLYVPAAAAQLPLQVHLAAQGSFKPLAESARSFASNATSLSDGFYLSVTCSEDVAFIEDQEIPAAVAGTFLGDFRIRQQRAACEGWPITKLGDSFLAPVVSDVPSLVISGERDPATPASDGEAAARTLRHSRHVIIPDAGHGLEGMKGVECIDDLIVKLVESGSVDALDTSCAAKIERPAFALDAGAPEVKLSQTELEPFVGTYAAKEGLAAKIDRIEGRLRLQLGGKAFLLVPISATRFRPEGLPDGYAIVFEKGDGPAPAATLVQPGAPEIRMVRQ